MTSAGWYVALGVVFAVGVLLLAISSAIMRAKPKHQQTPWPQLVDDSLTDADPALRVDMVERLAVVATPWSRDVLEQARKQERDPQVRGAIDRALEGSR